MAENTNMNKNKSRAIVAVNVMNNYNINSFSSSGIKKRSSKKSTLEATSTQSSTQNPSAFELDNQKNSTNRNFVQGSKNNNRTLVAAHTARNTSLNINLLPHYKLVSSTRPLCIHLFHHDTNNNPRKSLLPSQTRPLVMEPPKNINSSSEAKSSNLLVASKRSVFDSSTLQLLGQDSNNNPSAKDFFPPPSMGITNSKWNSGPYPLHHYHHRNAACILQ